MMTMMKFSKDTDSDSSRSRENNSNDNSSSNNVGEEWTLERHHNDDGYNDRDFPSGANDKTTTTESTGRIRRYICFAMAGCVMIASIIALLFVYGVLDNSHVPQGFFDSDPFGGRVKAGNPEDAHAWANGGSGLRLTVVNAVDESWQSFFAAGVADWENGTPNSLTLPTSKVAAEMQCDPQTGVLKVCNGNYGETGWKGLNAVLLDRTTRDIRASSAMMNDHYLAPDNDVERTYTMCHELGHGFGLPHWDENFWNRDLGNCMDYTNSPQNNQRPDVDNFEFLAAMYGEVGVVPPTTTPDGGNAGGGQNGSGSSSNNAKNKNDKDKDNKDRRDRRQLLRGTATQPSSSRHGHLMEEELSNDVRIRYRDAMEQLLQSVSAPATPATGRTLHEHEHGIGLEFDLGDDVILEAHLLKAV